MAGKCARAKTGGNLLRIQRETGMDPWEEPVWKLMAAIGRAEVPPQDGYRVQYLMKLLAARRELKVQSLDTAEHGNLIDSLCSS